MKYDVMNKRGLKAVYTLCEPWNNILRNQYLEASPLWIDIMWVAKLPLLTQTFGKQAHTFMFAHRTKAWALQYKNYAFIIYLSKRGTSLECLTNTPPDVIIRFMKDLRKMWAGEIATFFKVMRAK